jgi:hypothetical protein
MYLESGCSISIFTHSTCLIVVGNKLDGPMLSTILHCLEKHFAPELALKYLENLILLPRFNIVGSFLESSEKQGNPDPLILNTCCAATFQFTWIVICVCSFLNYAVILTLFLIYTNEPSGSLKLLGIS